MCCTLRAVPNYEAGCQTYLHWKDVEAAYLTLPEPRPKYVFQTVDNGSGYDPTGEESQYYAARFAEKYELELLFVIAYAHGQSALNYHVERPKRIVNLSTKIKMKTKGR